jgi:enoyl-CoA hydratase/carnithine racemase
MLRRSLRNWLTAPRAYEGVKRLFYGATNTSLAEQMEFETEWLTDMAGTADVQEGIAAFLAKRPSQFAGL